MEKIEEAFARTRDAVKKVSPGSGALEAVAAGVLAGLAIAGVAAMIDEANKKNARKKSWSACEGLRERTVLRLAGAD